jgi:pimeloyl-ACP methyl ester carboxylesterase
MMARLGKSLLRLCALFALLIPAALAGLYFFQETLLFHPGEPLPADFKFAVRLPFEERFVAAGPDRIHGLLVRANHSRGLILYFHGNAGNLEDWADLAEDLARHLHWSIWMIDYPGFGKSGGKIDGEERLHRDADAVFAAASTEAGNARLVVMGRSIGTGLAVRLAALNSVSGLVLESPYYSMVSLARRYYPWAPSFLLKYKLNSFILMPRVKAPALVLHGVHDEIIPYEEGKTLAALSPAAKFVLLENGHHNDLGHFPKYWDELGAFLGSLNHR